MAGRDGTDYSCSAGNKLTTGRENEEKKSWRDGTVIHFSWTGLDGNFFPSAERDGKYTFLLLLHGLGAVVCEDFPALLIARREPARRRRCSSRP